MKEGLIKELEMQKAFFLNTINCLSEEDSNFKPNDNMFTVAQHIWHGAETIDWLMEGALGKGFEAKNEREIKYKNLDNCSFDDSIKFLNEATARGIETIKNSSDAELMAPFIDEFIKGAPKLVIVNIITDHTAHHRGALSVYARLLGRTPTMPYTGM